MQNLNTKLILTDADGVLLRWEQPFRQFMEQHGIVFNDKNTHSYNLIDHYQNISMTELNRLIIKFNTSEYMKSLPALRDSAEYVSKLHNDHGFEFRVITSYGTDIDAIERRKHNLHSIFGSAIESLISVEMGGPKDHILADYANTGSWWIEDKKENADIGHRLGLRSLLIKHSHNINHKCNYPIVNNWKEIYDIITTN